MFLACTHHKYFLLIPTSSNKKIGGNSITKDSRNRCEAPKLRRKKSSGNEFSNSLVTISLIKRNTSTQGKTSTSITQLFNSTIQAFYSLGSIIFQSIKPMVTLLTSNSRFKLLMIPTMLFSLAVRKNVWERCQPKIKKGGIFLHHIKSCKWPTWDGYSWCLIMKFLLKGNSWLDFSPIWINFHSLRTGPKFFMLILLPKTNSWSI